jgi:hypothetical protein
MDMPTVLGKQVGIAFKAVRQCHEDLRQLIADFDSLVSKRGLQRAWSLDAVTYGVSRAAYAPYWMASKLYRVYHDPEKHPNVIEGINIRFFADDGSLDEPKLIAGRIAYTVAADQTVENVAQVWDLDDAYRQWSGALPNDLGKPLTCRVESHVRVERACVVATDLYSIQSIDDVTSLLEQVRAHAGF